MKASPTIQRIAVPFVLAVVIACVVTPFSDEAAALLFLLVLLPSWIALFFAWPFLTRKLSFDSQRPAALRQPHWFSFSRLVITGMLGLLVSAMLAVAVNSDFGAIFGAVWILLLWLALYFGWYYLTRRFPFLNTEIARARPAPASPAGVQPRRPRSAWKNAKELALVLLFLFLLFLPVMLSFQKARAAHDSIHVGMTVAEVLPTVKQCDLFSASSDFLYDKRADRGTAPELRLSWNKDGTYQTFDPAGRAISMTESEALEYLHATLHDGYTWTFYYTYNNMTPEHVTFHVVFGTDGRVSEVKDIYGFD